MPPLLLKCPRCGNNMKYQSMNSKIGQKKKRCVYCGHSFSVRNQIIKRKN